MVLVVMFLVLFIYFFNYIIVIVIVFVLFNNFIIYFSFILILKDMGVFNCGVFVVGIVSVSVVSFFWNGWYFSLCKFWCVLFCLKGVLDNVGFFVVVMVYFVLVEG